MEKLVNMQMPVQITPVKAEAKQTKKSESSGGFDKLLKQQTDKETPKQEDVKKADAEPKGETFKADKEEPQEKAEQLAAQLAAQQAAVQNLVTEWEEAGAEEILPVAALEEAAFEPAAGTLPLEEGTPAILKLGEMPQMEKIPGTTASKMEVSKELQTAANVQQAADEGSREEIPGIENAETPQSGDKNASDEMKTAVGQSEMRQEEDTQAVDGRKEQTSQEAAYAVQSGRSAEHTETMQTFQKTEETVIKSTVEELPQELGKALTGQRTSGNQVLTVELEPASLGKLTIRLEYEAGRAAVSIMASNPKTQELLNEKATEIASILKERTGEDTVIYTHQPEREPGREEQSQSGHGGQNERQQREEKREETDSFAQQLRLGLV